MSSMEFGQVKDVLPHILEFLPVEDLKQVREVSKTCDDVVRDSLAFQQNTTYHVNGCEQRFKGNPDILDQEIENLATNQTRWTRFHFRNLDLEKVFFGKEAYFDSFVTNYAHTLQSLKLTSCKLGLGRLIELLAFCPLLDELLIRKCPSLFDTGMDIVNWTPFMLYFNKTLSRMKHFAIEDLGLTLHAPNLHPWLKYMRKLVKLELKNAFGSVQLPLDCICRVLSRNVKTLRHLSLIGSRMGIAELTSSVCATLQNLNLESLTLGYFKFGDTMNFSNFIKSQANLRFLELRKIVLRAGCFYQISSLAFLVHVVLRDCFVEEKSCICLMQLSRASFQKLDLIQLAYNNEPGIYWENLFSGLPKLNLKELRITMMYADTLLSIISQNCIYLEELSLTGLGRSHAEPLHLEYIFQLRYLKRLSLKSCGLKDLDFLPELRNLDEKTLSDLQNLEYLDLSFNNIGEETILMQVILLTELTDLIVVGTQITKETLNQINVDRKKGRWTNLRRISAKTCSRLFLNTTNFVNLRFAFDPVKLLVDVDDSN